VQSVIVNSFRGRIFEGALFFQATSINVAGGRWLNTAPMPLGDPDSY
jgi:hypothetical protein